MNVQLSNDAPPAFAVYWRIIRLKWRLVAAMTLLCLVLGITYALLSTRIYRATVLVSSVATESGPGQLSGIASQFSGLAALAGVNLSQSGSSKDESLAILTSPGFVIDFVESRNLRAKLFADRWNTESGDWLDPAEIPSPYDAYIYFVERVLQVDEDPATGIIRLNVFWIDPHEAADWANDLIATLNEKMRARAIDEANQSIEFLTAELDKIELTQIRQGVFELIQERIGHAMMAQVRKEFAFTVLDSAIPPDEDRPERPNKIMIVGASLIIGVLIGFFAAFVRISLGAISSS